MKKTLTIALMIVMFLIPSCNHTRAIEQPAKIVSKQEVKKERACSFYAVNLTIDKVLFFHIEPAEEGIDNEEHTFSYILFPMWVVEKYNKENSKEKLANGYARTMKRQSYNVTHGISDYGSRVIENFHTGRLDPIEGDEGPCNIHLILKKPTDECEGDLNDFDIL